MQLRLRCYWPLIMLLWFSTHVMAATDKQGIGPWQETTPLPQALAAPWWGGKRLIFHDGRVYVFGGQNADDSRLSQIYYSTIGANGSLDTWYEASLPAKYFDQDVVKIGDYVYLISGANGDMDVYYALINQDGSLGTWHNTYALSPSRQGFALATYEHFIYAVAGNSAGTRDFVYFTAVTAEHALNPWQLTTALPEPTESSHTVVAYNAHLYVLSHTGHVYYAAIHTDGSLSDWKTTTQLPEVMDRYSLFEYGGYLYLLGGLSNAAYYALILEDGTLEAWQTTTTLPVHRLGLRAGAYNGFVYAIGGSNGNEFKNTVYYAPIATTESTLSETCPHATYTSSGQLHIPLLDVDLFGHTRQTFEVELQQRSEEFIFEIMTVKPLPLCDYYGISITSPQPGELSEAFFTVSGTYAVKPPQDSLQLFNVLPNKQHYWPQPRETIQFDPFNKTWHGDFYLGGEPPQEALIMVAIMQESGRILSDYYAKVGQETDMWPALDALTADIVACDQVLITKVK